MNDLKYPVRLPAVPAVANADPKLAEVAKRAVSREIAWSGPEAQEQAAQAVFARLAEIGAIGTGTVDTMGAYLDPASEKTLVVEFTEEPTMWLEIEIATGSTYWVIEKSGEA